MLMIMNLFTLKHLNNHSQTSSNVHIKFINRRNIDKRKRDIKKNQNLHTVGTPKTKKQKNQMEIPWFKDSWKMKHEVEYTFHLLTL